MKQQRSCSSSRRATASNTFIHAAVLLISPLNNCFCKVVPIYKSHSLRCIRSSETFFCLISFVAFFSTYFFVSRHRRYLKVPVPKALRIAAESSAGRSKLLLSDDRRRTRRERRRRAPPPRHQGSKINSAGAATLVRGGRQVYLLFPTNAFSSRLQEHPPTPANNDKR